MCQSLDVRVKSGSGVTIRLASFWGCHLLPPDSIITCDCENACISWFSAPNNMCKHCAFVEHIYWNLKYAEQLQTVDHSVRWSMKNAASCVKRCEMQDTPSTWFSNAYCSLGSFPGLRLSEGRYEIKIIIQVCFVEYAVLSCCTRQTYSYTMTAYNSRDSCALVLSFNSLAIHTAEHYTFCWLVFVPISHKRHKSVKQLCLCQTVAEYIKFYTYRIVLLFFCRPQIKRDYPLNLSI